MAYFAFAATCVTPLAGRFRSTAALGMTKQLLNKSMTNSLEEQLELEGQLQLDASGRYDYQEGVNAFLEKRKPEFKGK